MAGLARLSWADKTNAAAEDLSPLAASTPEYSAPAWDAQPTKTPARPGRSAAATTPVLTLPTSIDVASTSSTGAWRQAESLDSARVPQEEPKDAPRMASFGSEEPPSTIPIRTAASNSCRQRIVAHDRGHDAARRAASAAGTAYVADPEECEPALNEPAMPRLAQPYPTRRDDALDVVLNRVGEGARRPSAGRTCDGESR